MQCLLHQMNQEARLIDQDLRMTDILLRVKQDHLKLKDLQMHNERLKLNKKILIIKVEALNPHVPPSSPPSGVLPDHPGVAPARALPPGQGLPR